MDLLRANRSFAHVWAAGLCFMLASWALHAVMLIHIFDLTRSPFATGLIPVFASIPGIVLGPVAGVVVDRGSRSRLMAWCALALVVLLVAVVPMTGTGSVSLLYTIILLQAIVMTFFSPAENALLPSLVPDRDLATGNALNALNDSLGRIIGPAVGAWCLIELGLAGVFVVCAAIYGVGWLLLLRVEDPDGAAESSTAGTHAAPFRSSIRTALDGIRVVRASMPLLLLVGISALFLLADVPLSAVLPAFMRESVGVSAEVFGSLMSVRGLTGLAGGVLVVWLSRRVPAIWLLGGGLLLHGLSFFAFGAGNNLPVSVLVLFPIGPAAAAIQTGLFTLLQQMAPDAYRGRVFALIGLVGGLVTLVASASAGAIAEITGTRAIVMASGCLHLLPLVVTFVLLRHGAGNPARSLVALRGSRGEH